MTVVGHVAGLCRYPVKSMAGEELDAAEVSWHGLDPAILRTIARDRDARFGVYGSIVAPGQVAAGDPVELES